MPPSGLLLTGHRIVGLLSTASILSKDKHSYQIRNAEGDFNIIGMKNAYTAN
jgi:hypothetical protein